MSELTFVSAYRRPEGKQGKLPRDANGRYEVLAGAYNEITSGDEIYSFTQRVKNLFTKSTMITKLNNNQLFGEADHPSLDDFISKTRSEKEAVALWVNRLRRIVTSNISHQTFGVRFAELDKRVDGRPVYGVYLWIEPINEILKATLDNPDSNTAFSVRSFVNRGYKNGRVFCETTDIITHDWVAHGGIPLATKFNSPGLQSESPTLVQDGAYGTIDSGVITELESIDRIGGSAGNESGDIVSTIMIRGMMGWQEVPNLNSLASRLI